MPADKLITNKSAQKNLNKLPSRIHIRVIEVFSKIKNNPLSGAPLSGELAGYRKYRIGDYRIVYKFDSKKSTVEVVKVENRKGVYR